MKTDAISWGEVPAGGRTMQISWGERSPERYQRAATGLRGVALRNGATVLWGRGFAPRKCTRVSWRRGVAWRKCARVSWGRGFAPRKCRWVQWRRGVAGQMGMRVGQCRGRADARYSTSSTSPDCNRRAMLPHVEPNETISTAPLLKPASPVSILSRCRTTEPRDSRSQPWEVVAGHRSVPS